MNLVKSIFGKTVTRVLTGQPGNLQEFFEMTKEKRENEITVKSKMNFCSLTDGISNYTAGIAGFDCRSSALSFYQGKEVFDVNYKELKGIENSLIENLLGYSRLFPEIKIKLKRKRLY